MLRIPEKKATGNKPTLKKLEAYGEYLRKLLDSHEYYCFALFKFINFDFIKGEATGGDNKLLLQPGIIQALSYKKIDKTFTLLGLPFEV